MALGKMNTGRYWIGISDASNEGYWVWIDGSKNTWRNWKDGKHYLSKDGKPKAAYRDNAFVNAGDGKWYASIHWNEYGSVCKVPGKKSLKLTF